MSMVPYFSLQAMKGPDMGPGMSRMPGPHGMGPRGMGSGGMVSYYTLRFCISLFYLVTMAFWYSYRCNASKLQVSRLSLAKRVSIKDRCENG